MSDKVRSTAILRGHWDREAQNIPRDAPLYVEALAERVLILISDVETLERRLMSVVEVAQGGRSKHP